MSEEVNRISYELALRWTKGRHAFIVTSHTDTSSISKKTFVKDYFLFSQEK